MQWQSVIGLEVHTQLSTKSKIFSFAPTEFGASPNAQASEIDLGLPGTLPFLNKEVINMAIKLGLGINSTINKRSIFARKNYFYPDLPKGYQITQNKFPIITGGSVNIEDEENNIKKINITRAHLEEDAGKSTHYDEVNKSGIDLNRAGIALLEIVTEPDLRSAKEAISFLKTLHTLVRYLEICDGNMQEGSFRCDANISMRMSEDAPLGTRVEIKNINSFKFVGEALNYEIQRQIDCINHGEKINQETRLYDPSTKTTKAMRDKEDAHDYRYFADPDLPPLIVEQETIDELRASMPELPWDKKARLESEYSLSSYDAKILIADKNIATYFEEVCSKTKADNKLVANWVCGELSAYLNRNNISITACPVSPSKLASLLNKITDDTISGKIAKTIFEYIWENDIEVEAVIKEQGLNQISAPSELEAIIVEIMTEFPDQTNDYKNGKDKLFGFFVGQMMKRTQGKGNPKLINELLLKLLSK
jgi:aspartyl-tRNA(Asn)/glutamyl-tRNA(Gln) amidotransferase subunit B